MQLHNFDIDIFLSDYWQKKPLLIKNPWETWRNPLEPDELAGLACEEEIESRLIVQTGAKTGDGWSVEHGPFAEARFGQLGQSSWTLLVQAVDHHVADVAALIAPFRFVPNWRIDDVMVSYATDAGGVGPHFDQYDVFLIQGLGTRRWQVGELCDAATPLLPNDDLRLLAEFEATQEWMLEPGDILYVPPRLAHNGIAVGNDCMTYSIGFRAPSRSELIAEWVEDLVTPMEDDDRYSDANLHVQDNPGEISPQAIAGLHSLITETMGDEDAFARWFGKYSSTPKYSYMDWRPEEPIESAQVRVSLASGAPLCRNPASRFMFVRRKGGSILLFVDGQCFEPDSQAAKLSETLCAHDRVCVDPLLEQSEGSVELITQLVNQGSLAFEHSD